MAKLLGSRVATLLGYLSAQVFLYLVSAFFIAGTNSSVFAFSGHGTDAIEGKVLDSKSNPLIGAQVWLEGHKIGDMTDETGWYKIEVPMCGQFKVVYQYIGFKPETLTVTVTHGQQVRKNVILRESTIQFKEVKVKGRKETIHRTKTPKPTTVIPYEAAERVGASTIGEACELEAGIKMQSKCSMCGASEISIQGLPGRFSLVLLDGMPVFSGLASKYILDMFPLEFMDRIEILKGASGAIWGSDAIAGAVNILLPRPSKQLVAKGSYAHRSYGSDFSGAFSNSLKSVNINAMAARSDRNPVDLNDDNISENTAYLRNIYLVSMGISPRQWDFDFGGSFVDEVRKRGAIVMESEYGINPDAEKVSTQRWDIWHQSRLGLNDKSLKFKLAISSHGEDGIVEMRDYSAEQKTLYGEFSAKAKKLVTGISLSRQFLSDTRLFEAYNENNWGIWTSAESRLFEADFLAAGRVDFNSDYGTIFSPYGAIKFLLGGIDFNLAAGTGFRTPTVIFESLQCMNLSGYQYVVRRDKDLSKEASISLEGGLGKKIMFKNFMANFKLNFFRHRVSNFINARFEGIDRTTGKAVFYYYNLDEVITSTGTELSTTFALSGSIDITLGTFVLSPKFANGQTLPFINQWGLNYSTTYKNKPLNFELSATGKFNGPMVVQTVYEDDYIRSSDSPIYNILNLRVAKSLSSFNFIMGVNNLFNYYQPPLSHGMTEYYWGPIIGREFYGRISVELGGRHH